MHSVYSCKIDDESVEVDRMDKDPYEKKGLEGGEEDHI